MAGEEVTPAAGIIDQAETDVLKKTWRWKDAARFIRSLPDEITDLPITYLSDSEDVIALLKKLGCSYVQLHGDLSSEMLAC